MIPEDKEIAYKIFTTMLLIKDKTGVRVTDTPRLKDRFEILQDGFITSKSFLHDLEVFLITLDLEKRREKK